MDETGLQKKEKLLLIFLALLIGILFDYLFYEKPAGASYPVFVFLLLSLFWWSTRKMLIVKKSFGWFVLIPILMLSAAFAIYSNPVLEGINFLLIPLLIVVHTLLVTGKSSAWSELSFTGDIFRWVVPRIVLNFPKPFVFMAEEFKSKEPGPARVAWKKIITGLLISIPVLAVIVPLLSSADLMFDYYLTNLTRLKTVAGFDSIVEQGIVILFVFVYLLSYIWSFHVNHPQTAAKKNSKAFFWDPTILLTVLCVINTVYLLFSVIQFSYLYGGDRHSLPIAFTYAEYARRGFFELVAVTIINLSILLGGMRFVNKENQALYTGVRGLLSLLVVFSLNMLFSAHFKMSLYEEAYGLTYLRIFVHYFLFLLLVLFLLALVNIWLGKPPLVKAYIVVALAFYTVLNFINVDKIIARNNIDMYLQTGKLDVYYLQALSYDAIPEMIRLAEGNNRDMAQVKEFLLRTKKDLAKPGPWQAFNYSRYKAGLTLKENIK